MLEYAEAAAAPASDRLTRACAEILLNPSATRERLTVDIFHGIGDEGLTRLERAFALTVAVQPLRDRLHKAHARDVEKARREGLGPAASNACHLGGAFGSLMRTCERPTAWLGM